MWLALSLGCYKWYQSLGYDSVDFIKLRLWFWRIYEVQVMILKNLWSSGYDFVNFVESGYDFVDPVKLGFDL